MALLSRSRAAGSGQGNTHRAEYARICHYADQSMPAGMLLKHIDPRVTVDQTTVRGEAQT